jgi:hypothetical protein
MKPARLWSESEAPAFPKAAEADPFSSDCQKSLQLTLDLYVTHRVAP